jgi:hypothetical protein
MAGFPRYKDLPRGLLTKLARTGLRCIMYGTPMPDTFIRLDTLEYNTIRVPTQFVNNLGSEYGR